ncbi:18043_t:CDS:2, partial [Rhizophagus irregularis]
FYPIFQAAFEAAYKKYELHIPNHPTHSLFCAYMNGVFSGLEFDGSVDESKLDVYWNNLTTHLLILSQIAFDYIWLPISSCAVEHSFSLYNTFLDNDHQNFYQKNYLNN